MKLVPIESLRLHTDAERVPMASPGDLAALRQSLAEYGQQDPIDVVGDVILDGRTRWTLLRELGATTVGVRDLDVPEGQQSGYIVDRALARRHLTAEQKRALNALIREMTVEVAAHPKTGEEVRIGKGPTQRAATLGVGRMTVNTWDRDDRAGVPNGTPALPAPTHLRRADGQIEPLHPNRKPAEPSAERPPRPEPLRKSRPIPAWSRHATSWLRLARPEDRDFLRRIDREVHAALDRNDIECERKTP